MGWEYKGSHSRSFQDKDRARSRGASSKVNKVKTSRVQGDRSTWVSTGVSTTIVFSNHHAICKSL